MGTNLPYPAYFIVTYLITIKQPPKEAVEQASYKMTYILYSFLGAFCG